MSKSLVMRNVREFARDEAGATAIEYALIASGIAAAIIAVVMSVGTSVSDMYSSVSNSLN